MGPLYRRYTRRYITFCFRALAEVSPVRRRENADRPHTTHKTPTDRIAPDPDHYERSPSTGPEETTRILDARDGYDHEPPSDDDAEPVTIDAVPPADTDTDAARSPREVSA